MSESVFEKIAKRELPAYVVWEDDMFIAFLSINPLAKGHTLVVPKENWGDYLFDLDNDKYQKLMLVSKNVAALIKEKLSCERVLMWVEGFEVPHVHVHLIPGRTDYGMRNAEFQKFTSEEFEAIRREISE